MNKPKNQIKQVNWRFFWFKENVGGLFVGETNAENLNEAIKKIGHKSIQETYKIAKKGNFLVEEDQEPQLVRREPITQKELEEREKDQNSVMFFRYTYGAPLIEYKHYKEELKLIVKANIILSKKELKVIK